MLPFFKTKWTASLIKRTKSKQGHHGEAMSWGACTGHGSWDASSQHEKIRGGIFFEWVNFCCLHTDLYADRSSHFRKAGCGNGECGAG